MTIGASIVIHRARILHIIPFQLPLVDSGPYTVTEPAALAASRRKSSDPKKNTALLTSIRPNALMYCLYQVYPLALQSCRCTRPRAAKPCAACAAPARGSPTGLSQKPVPG